MPFIGVLPLFPLTLVSSTGHQDIGAAMVSFVATYKPEGIGLAGDYATRTEATTDFFVFAETHYNRERFHSGLGYQSPVDFERQLN